MGGGGGVGLFVHTQVIIPEFTVCSGTRHFIFSSLCICLSPPLPVSTEFFGDTTGLLGRFNGDASDDFVNRTGSTLSPNATEQKLFFYFGRSCKRMRTSVHAVLLLLLFTH